MQPSWCSRGSGGKDEGDVGSRALPRVAEVCSGKGDGHVSMVDLLLFAKKGEDTVPNVIGTTIGTERKG